MMNGDMLDEGEVREFVIAFPQRKKKTVKRTFNDKNQPNSCESSLLRFQNAHRGAVEKAFYCSVPFPLLCGVIIPTIPERRKNEAMYSCAGPRDPRNGILLACTTAESDAAEVCSAVRVRLWKLEHS